MKRTIILSILISTIVSLGSYAQVKPNDPRHVNIYNEIASLETDEYSINIQDVVSNFKYAKFKIIITNKTADYLLFKGEELTFVSGTIATKAKEKPVFIDPFSSKSKVIEFKGDENYHVDNFDVTITGIYRIAIAENNFNGPDFQLPPNAKEITAGPYTINLLKTEQQTQLTWARFSCKYNGQKIGFINPAKCVVKIQEGNEFSTTNLKPKYELLLPGEESKFYTEFQIPAKITDMQFATMNIIWKDSFSESNPVALKSNTVNFSVDQTKTDIKNKK